jgi:cytochrome c oxidase assembly protein subunit 15
MKATTNIAFILVFMVVLAGSIVRMTGSGMGCPDWPKCFGLLIPPTSEDQVRWAPDTDYSTGMMVIERDTLWRAVVDHTSTDSSSPILDSANWEPYTRHDYAEFNAVHTWIEYLNRLAGALSGIPILLLFSLALTSRRRTPIILASGTLGSVLFVSWLGKLVVDGNLIPFSVTIHAVSALMILVFLVAMMQHLDGSKFTISKRARFWIIASLVLAFSQLVFGTQVREQVDLALEAGVSRPDILDSLPSWWKAHRTAVWPIIAVHLLWAVPLLKNSGLRVFAGLALGILFAQSITGVLFTHLGMPALVQPMHIMLGFGLILIDLRALLASKV